MSSKSNALLNVWARLSIGLVIALTLTGCCEKRSDDVDMSTSTVPPQPSELPDSVNMTISGSFTLAGLGSQGFISEYRAAIARSIADVYRAPVNFVEVNVVSMSMRRLMPSSLRRLDDIVKVMFSITIPEASAPEVKENISRAALEMSETTIRRALSSVLPREIQVASVVLPVLRTASTTSTTSEVITTSKSTTNSETQVHTTTTVPDVTATPAPKMSTTSRPTAEITTTLGPLASTSASTTLAVVASTTSGPKATMVTTTRTTEGSTTSGQKLSMSSTTSTTLKVGTSSTTADLLSTKIANSAQQGDTQIKTKSVAGFKLGMAIVIDPDTPLMEFNTIKAFGTIDLNSPLLFSHPEGTVVREKTSEDTTTSPNPCIATTTVTNPCMSVVRKFELGYKNEQPLVNVVGWGIAGFAGVVLTGMLVVAVMRCASPSRGETFRYSTLQR